jgi:hypothetical protein
LGAVAKHRAGDIEQPIADRAEGACVAVTTLSQSSVLGVAASVVLNGDARPVIEGVLEPGITGKSSGDDTALAGALGDRCSATKGSQSDSLVAGGLPIPLRAAWRGRSDRFLARM